MALSAPRSTINKGVDKVILNNLDVMLRASVVVYDGALIVMSAGYGKPGVAGLGLQAVGVARLPVASYTGGATDGANFVGTNFNQIKVEQGVFRLNNSASGDLIAQANVGQICYVVDDQTVALTNGTGTRSPAGVIMEVDAGGVWVSLSQQIPAAAANAGTAYQGNGSIEAVSAAGAISVNTEITTLAVTGTTAYTLANGLFPGQKKTVTVISGATTPIGTITPTAPSGFATVTALGVLGDSVQLIWTGAAWILGPSFGVTFT